MKDVVIIGYSGHALVVADILAALGMSVAGYCDLEEKPTNALGIQYLGHEASEEGLSWLRRCDFFVAIGDNRRRHKVVDSLLTQGFEKPITIFHPASTIASTATIGFGVMVGPGSILNSFTSVGEGVVCNSGCVIEHECVVGAYAHIAPGAVLAGNVTVGSHSFVGANAVVKEGVTIGEHCLIGAGSVIIRDVPDGAKVVGNPGRTL